MIKNNNISNPFISVDYWITISDIVISYSYKNGSDNYNYKKEIDKALEIKTRPIIFLKTDLIEKYIDLLLNFPSQYILIMASNDDHCVPYLYYPCRNNVLKKKADLLIESNNLINLYCKNPCIKHDKIFPLPIGPKWQWKTTQFFGESKEKHIKIYNELCSDPKQSLLNKSTTDINDNLLYFNFSKNTTNAPLFSSHRGIRNNIYNIFIKDFKYNSNTGFEEYMKILKKYKFSISPPGRGIDAHRTWESLMVGTIPIISETTLNKVFEKLPVIILKDDEWSNITVDYLKIKYNEIIKNIELYDFSICYTEFWDKIFNM